MFMRIYLIVILLSVFTQVSSKKARIAIVGSGIGGSSCAYFLRDQLKSDIDIDLYEAKEIGGRLATVEHEYKIYEVGGCVIHERNKYMNMFIEKFGLTHSVGDHSIEILAIRDSDGYKFCTSQFTMVTYVKAFWNFGFMSLYRLHKFINSLLNKFDNIYKLQNAGKAFLTVAKLFAAVDPNFSRYFKISAKEGFRSYVYLNRETIDDLIRATLRVNYSQSTDVHMFVGSVSIAAGMFFGKMWAIYGGNKRVPELLVQESEANFLNNRVVKIEFDKAKAEYVVESVSSLTNEKLVKRYDVVVIANPITSDSKTPIEFANFNPPIHVEGRYQRVVATLVAGNLNARYHIRGWFKAKVPDLIINNDDPVVSSISQIGQIFGVKETKTPIWKIFSERPLKNAELEDLIKTPKIIETRDWLAYPKYEKMNLSSGNFVLHDRLFYVNAIEWAASAMEMSVIGAKNVALLIEKELRSTGKDKQEVEK